MNGVWGEVCVLKVWLFHSLFKKTASSQHPPPSLPLLHAHDNSRGCSLTQEGGQGRAESAA